MAVNKSKKKKKSVLAISVCKDVVVLPFLAATPLKFARGMRIDDVQTSFRPFSSRLSNSIDVFPISCRSRSVKHAILAVTIRNFYTSLTTTRVRDRIIFFFFFSPTASFYYSVLLPNATTSKNYTRHQSKFSPAVAERTDV